MPQKLDHYAPLKKFQENLQKKCPYHMLLQARLCEFKSRNNKNSDIVAMS